MAFFTAMALTFQPIRRLSDLAGLWQVAEASLERIYTLFDTARRPRARRQAAPGPPPVRPRCGSRTSLSIIPIARS